MLQTFLNLAILENSLRIQYNKNRTNKNKVRKKCLNIYMEQ